MSDVGSVSPTSVALILKQLLAAEPTAIAILQALYPDSPAVAEALKWLPTLLPILQKIEGILEELGQPVQFPMLAAHVAHQVALQQVAA